MQGEATSVNVEAAASYTEDPAKIITKGGYTKQLIFNANEISLIWKKMPSRHNQRREVNA